MDNEVRRYLDDLVATARDVLGENLTGAYAAGSIGLNAYQPGRSDVDVALVSADAVSEHQKHELVRRLRHEALPCPARGLELVVYRRAVAESGSPEPGFEVELNTGARMDFRETYSPDERAEADGRFWYALDRSILHQAGYALVGPSAAEMFADLGRSDLRRLLIEALSWWLALPTPAPDDPAPGTEDAVLGACRSLVKYRYGDWLSKADAGRRLVAAGYAADLIERSIAARDGGTPPTGSEARGFQHNVLDEIRDSRAFLTDDARATAPSRTSGGRTARR